MAAAAPAAPAHVPAHMVFAFDIFDDARLKPDPQAGYTALLGQAPDLFYTPLNGGHWVATRYETISRILKDPATFSNRNMQIPKSDQTFVMLPLTLDPPEHAPYRQILMQQFSAKAMHAVEPHIRDWAERLLDAVADQGADQGACDFVASVSGLLPVSVFMQLMGLPLDRLEEFRAWVDESFAASDSNHRMAVYGRIMGFMGEVIAQRAQAPRDDLVSRLLAAEIDGRRLSLDEVQGLSLLLFIAGMDTVANALSFGVRHLAQNPDLQREVAADPTLIPGLVDEILRRYAFTSTQRIVAQDVELDGAPMRAGDMLFLSFATAGVDDRFGPDAQAFDPRRANADQHLTFGGGPHKCAGRHLGRIEMRILFEVLLARWRNIRLTPGAAQHIRAGNVIAMDRLDIQFETA
ncbi:cytochrome P450 [Caulobacter rhizosphaerae]|uniref:Cytochrome P450 n=1 Tax=Caulobacter rhizosphaerae TaxID=2010972 RepID=A0ABU1MUR7_9CAUL|nr:cytochrome P450 [Caulobacter rhizosphaerae]MDR6529828.1 cytochrome P450 [Caulobacter rhizosphaerae]